LGEAERRRRCGFGIARVARSREPGDGCGRIAVAQREAAAVDGRGVAPYTVGMLFEEAAERGACALDVAVLEGEVTLVEERVVGELRQTLDARREAAAGLVAPTCLHRAVGVGEGACALADVGFGVGVGGRCGRARRDEL